MKTINCLLLCLLSSLAYGQGVKPNVLLNGDFTLLNPAGAPMRWFLSKHATHESDSQGYSMKIGPNSGRGAHLRSCAIDLRTKSRPPGAENQLLVRCKLKTSGLAASAAPETHFALVFRMFEGDPNEYGSTTGKFVSKTQFDVDVEQSEFGEKQFVVQVPDEARFGDFCVLALSDSAKETVWIRDVSIIWP